MEILYYALGVVTVLFIFGIVGTVWAIRKIITTESNLHSIVEALDLIEKHTDQNFNILRSDFEKRFDETDRTLNDDINDINKSLDSRLDKFENRLTRIFEDGCKPVQEK
jgi:hypothetical protein